MPEKNIVLMTPGKYVLAVAAVLVGALSQLPCSPKDPEAMEVWRKKLGKPLRIASPFLMLFGLAKIVSAL